MKQQDKIISIFSLKIYVILIPILILTILYSHILNSTTESVRNDSLLNVFLAEAKVRQFDVTLGV